MGGQIRTIRVAVTTVGGAGAATGATESSERVEGYLEDLYVDCDVACPGTTDVLVRQVGRAETIWARLNSNADAHIVPRVAAVDATNAAIAGSFARRPLNGRLRVEVADCNAITDAVIVLCRVRTL